MARSSRGVHRLLGAMQSRTIPAHARCHFHGAKDGRVQCGPVECIIVSPLAGRRYLCRLHGEQGKSLGYEVFDGERK